MKYIKKKHGKHRDVIEFKNRLGEWRSLNRKLKTKITAILLREQHGKCAYCEAKLYEIKYDSLGHYYHIEHVYPKSIYEEKMYSYYNIVLSCGHSNEDGSATRHCGASKQNYDPALGFISPLSRDCQKHFRYSYSGEIRANDEAAEKTIDILDLNHPNLVNKRRELINVFISGVHSREQIDKLINAIPNSQEFYSTIIYVLNSL